MPPPDGVSNPPCSAIRRFLSPVSGRSSNLTRLRCGSMRPPARGLAYAQGDVDWTKAQLPGRRPAPIR